MEEQDTQEKGTSFPVTFKQYVANPFAVILFLPFFAMIWLYVDARTSYTTQIEKQAERIEVLEAKISILHDKILELSVNERLYRHE